MPHVALLGDSVFDNGAYVDGGPDVAAQLRATLAVDWEVSLLAIDGSFTDSVGKQLEEVPSDCTHLFLSSGGNDALNQIQVLGEPVTSVSQALAMLAEVAGAFRASYQELLAAIGAKGLPTAVCTIYNPNDSDPQFNRAASGALSFFNDVIITQASAARFDVLDLRKLFVAPEDYANPIEPSTIGGAKLAETIARIVMGNARRASSIWP